MPRVAVVIEKIKEDKPRKACYEKRKGGLIKKAIELSILTGCTISLVIFDEQGTLDLAYSSKNLERVNEEVMEQLRLSEDFKILDNNDYNNLKCKSNKKRKAPKKEKKSQSKNSKIKTENETIATVDTKNIETTHLNMPENSTSDQNNSFLKNENVSDNKNFANFSIFETQDNSLKRINAYTPPPQQHANPNTDPKASNQQNLNTNQFFNSGDSNSFSNLNSGNFSVTLLTPTQLDDPMGKESQKKGKNIENIAINNNPFPNQNPSSYSFFLFFFFIFFIFFFFFFFFTLFSFFFFEKEQGRKRKRKMLSPHFLYHKMEQQAIEQSTYKETTTFQILMLRNHFQLVFFFFFYIFFFI